MNNTFKNSLRHSNLQYCNDSYEYNVPKLHPPPDYSPPSIIVPGPLPSLQLMLLGLLARYKQKHETGPLLHKR